MGTSKLILLIFSMNDSKDDKYAANCLNNSLVHVPRMCGVNFQVEQLRS